ncbi:MAG: hypothetical protein UU76_C0007G0022 [Parcubacteria group bacterium GW2011_GWC1_41_7]|nr:MAG: hypothetical protein UU76_C0007G0022 [Parcubacteria group bacterium GW2011_GWC1_41_7]
MPNLTPKQTFVLRAIREYHGQFKVMPSVRRLQQFLSEKFGMNLQSPQSIQQYIEALIEKGYLRKSGRFGRVELVQKTDARFFTIPIVGWVNAGTPSYEIQQEAIGFLRVSRGLIKRSSPNMFSINVVGDSMNARLLNGKCIEHRDYVLVDPDDFNFTDDGRDVVLASIDGTLTIKEFHRLDRNMIGLFPHSKNKDHQPIYVSPNDVVIVGKVVDVLQRSKTE